MQEGECVCVCLCVCVCVCVCVCTLQVPPSERGAAYLMRLHIHIWQDL